MEKQVIHLEKGTSVAVKEDGPTSEYTRQCLSLLSEAVWHGSEGCWLESQTERREALNERLKDGFGG